MKHLTFVLGDEEYAVDILAVQEIVGLLPITRIPRAAGCVRGVTNLRGKVIPIIDVRVVLGLEPNTENERCVVVLRDGLTHAGIVVDDVRDVLDIPADQIVAPPMFGDAVRTNVLIGLATMQGRLRLLIDVGRVLHAQRSDALQAASVAQ